MKTALVFLAVLAGLVLASEAMAGPQCGPQGYGFNYGGYRARPVAVPVVTTCYQPVIQVPTVIAVAVNTDYAFSVQAYYASALQLELARQQTALLQGQRGVAGQPGTTVGQQPPLTQGSPVMPQADAPPPDPNAGQQPLPPVQQPDPQVNRQGAGGAGADPRLVAVLQSSCVRCHGGAQGVKGNLNLTNPGAVPVQVRLDAYRQVKKGTMPKSAAPLSAEQHELFLEWIAAAATSSTATARK